MVTDINLFEKSLDQLTEVARTTEATIKARQTLIRIVNTIKKAGGDISEEELASSKVGDLAIIAARNGLVISVYQMDEEDSSEKKNQRGLEFAW